VPSADVRDDSATASAVAKHVRSEQLPGRVPTVQRDGVVKF